MSFNQVKQFMQAYIDKKVSEMEKKVTFSHNSSTPAKGKKKKEGAD